MSALGLSLALSDLDQTLKTFLQVILFSNRVEIEGKLVQSHSGTFRNNALYTQCEEGRLIIQISRNTFCNILIQYFIVQLLRLELKMSMCQEVFLVQIEVFSR